MSEEQKIRRFSEIADKTDQQQELTPLADLLNKEVVITEVDWRDGTFGPFAIIAGYMAENGDPFVFTTGGKVVCRKLEKYQTQLPFMCRIVRRKRYYDLE